MFNVVLVAHDAGGAELVSLWAKNNVAKFNLVISGPALDIFNKNLGTNVSSPLEEAISQASLVVTGTSCNSDLEKRARYIAKINGIKCITIIDHWLNYRERFMYNGKFCACMHFRTGALNENCSCAKL